MPQLPPSFVQALALSLLAFATWWFVFGAMDSAGFAGTAAAAAVLLVGRAG